jgi:ribosomal protein S27AE
MITEKVQLLGKGLYEKIPNELTIKAIPTISELEYVGAEDFDKTMLESIFPVAIEEFASREISPYDLLELDYRWICRCMRIVNYGPYYTTNAIYCSKCGKTSHGEFQVNLNTVNCIPFPDGFVNELKISRDEFIDFDGDVTLKLPTIKKILMAYKDTAFAMKNGDINLELARMCYMIQTIGTEMHLNPFEIKMIIQSKFSPADYMLLRDAINSITDFGLRAGGKAQCPKCGSDDGGFLALSDDRFFRPTVGDLKCWKADKNKRSLEDTTGSKTSKV